MRRDRPAKRGRGGAGASEAGDVMPHARPVGAPSATDPGDLAGRPKADAVAANRLPMGRLPRQMHAFAEVRLGDREASVMSRMVVSVGSRARGEWRGTFEGACLPPSGRGTTRPARDRIRRPTRPKSLEIGSAIRSADDGFCRCSCALTGLRRRSPRSGTAERDSPPDRRGSHCGDREVVARFTRIRVHAAAPTSPSPSPP